MDTARLRASSAPTSCLFIQSTTLKPSMNSIVIRFFDDRNKTGPTPLEFAISCKYASLFIVCLFASVLLILSAQILFLALTLRTILTQPLPAIAVLPILVLPVGKKCVIPNEEISFKRQEYSPSEKSGYEIIFASSGERMSISLRYNEILCDNLVDCIPGYTLYPSFLSCIDLK